MTSQGLPSDSTCILKAEPGKLDIRRHEPGSWVEMYIGGNGCKPKMQPWAVARLNLSSTTRDSNQSPQLHRLAGKLEFRSY